MKLSNSTRRLAPAPAASTGALRLTLPHEEFLPTPQAARLLHVSPRTLERMRCEGTGPQFIKAGRRCLYRRDVLLAWAESQSFGSTAEAKRSSASRQ